MSDDFIHIKTGEDYEKTTHIERSADHALRKPI